MHFVFFDKKFHLNFTLLYKFENHKLMIKNLFISYNKIIKKKG